MSTSGKIKVFCSGCSESAGCDVYKDNPNRTQSVDTIRVVGSLEPTGEMIGVILISNCAEKNVDVAIAAGVWSPDRVAQIDKSNIKVNKLPLANVMPDIEFQKIEHEMNLLPMINAPNNNANHKTISA